MNNESLEYMLDYAKVELDLINMTQSDLGKSMLNYLTELHRATSGNRMHMIAMIDMLCKLVKREPLSPITREEVNIESLTPEGNKVLGTPRYQFLLQDTDGEYYDYRGTTFVNSKGQEYYTGKSKVKAVFPFYPTKNVVLDDVNC